MKYAILLDFGSTYTKVVCVSLTERRIVLTDKFPSTVHTDACIAMNQCFDEAKAIIGEEAFRDAVKLSTSSAAGGLRIAVSGLTKSLSIEAGRNASFSAGGKIVHTVSGKITAEDVEAINASGAEILLFCGGYDSGNNRLVLHNANVISEHIMIPVIYAGNSHIVKEVSSLFAYRGKEYFIAENIIPKIGVLNISSTIDIVRNLFMSRITNMKGVGEVRQWLNQPIIPTPSAVLSAGELLYRGTDTEEGIGPYMMTDVGGATTDVYSFMENISYEGAKIVGSPEPFAKRTVEGDMGMRESSVCLVREVGEEAFASKCHITTDRVAEAVEHRNSNRAYVADTEEERRIDFHIASSAVRVSARRHAGTASKEFMDGCRLIQRGKNLTEIKTVIGTGGILVNNQETAPAILKNVTTDTEDRERILLPEKVDILLDRDYVFFAAGLLRSVDENAALAIMKQSIGLA